MTLNDKNSELSFAGAKDFIFEPCAKIDFDDFFAAFLGAAFVVTLADFAADAFFFVAMLVKTPLILLYGNSMTHL